jgi:hypothetical protein
VTTRAAFSAAESRPPGDHARGIFRSWDFSFAIFAIADRIFNSQIPGLLLELGLALASPVGGPHSLGEIRGAAAVKKTATGGEGAEGSAGGRFLKLKHLGEHGVCALHAMQRISFGPRIRIGF